MDVSQIIRATGRAPDGARPPAVPGTPVIEVRGLAKRYGETTAVDGIDLTVRESEIFALLGPNGAGKTTTVEMLEGYRRPDGPATVSSSGNVEVCRTRPIRARQPSPGVHRVLTEDGDRAASPVTFAVTLTLFFISGNFFAGAEMPRWLNFIADLFPVSHFNRAMTTAFNPNVSGAGFSPVELLILAAWAVGGALLGLWVFRWTPTGDR